MVVICMHCKKILVPENGKGGGVSHSDCMGYGGKPCKESIAWHIRNKLIDFTIAKRAKDGFTAFI